MISHNGFKTNQRPLKLNCGLNWLSHTIDKGSYLRDVRQRLQASLAASLRMFFEDAKFPCLIP